MVYDDILSGGGVCLRTLSLADCTESYLSWMNDPDINRYLESRHLSHSIESLRDFVKNARASEYDWPFAIVCEEDGVHIGNIKAGPVDYTYKNTFIGYVVGEKKYWGRGFGTAAIKLAADFCFNKLYLHKVSAGVIAPNAASARALEKAGFTLEGRFKDDAILNGEYVDVLRYGLVQMTNYK